MEFFNVAQELAHLIGVRLAADVLQIQRPIRQRMFVDVMAPADTIQTVAECLCQTAQLLQANVVRTGQHFIQQLTFAAHADVSTIMLTSQPNTTTTKRPTFASRIGPTTG